jgi:hypothetical protein
MAAIAPFFVSRALRFASQVGKTGPEAAQVRMGLRDTRKRDATGSPSRCGRLGSRYSPSFAKGPPRERLPYGWPPGCRRRKSRCRGPVPHAHSHDTRSALTRADPTASPTPPAHSRALRWPPCFGSHLPACRQPGSWIPPTPSVRWRLDHVREAPRDRDRQGHVSHDYRARRAAAGLLRTPTVSVASSYHSGTALPGLAKAPASRLPRPPLLPAESMPRVFAPPTRARPYARGYLPPQNSAFGSYFHSCIATYA